MPSFSSILVPLRRPLAVPLDRLCRSLDNLGREVREAIARAIAQAVSDAVRETVRAILEEPPHPHDRSGWSDRVPVRSPASWRETDEAYWASDPYSVEEEDDLLYPDRAGQQRSRKTQESFHPQSSQLPAGPRESAWRRALKAGCLAAAWWLRRPPGRFSILVALSVGLVAGLAALVGGPLAAVGAGIAGSALVLLGLVDAVRRSALAVVDIPSR